jgi:DNA-binding response OmpR family regulator
MKKEKSLVLVISQDQAQIKRLDVLFKAVHFRVISADSIACGMQKAMEDKPDCLVISAQFFGSDSRLFCQAIKKDFKLGYLPGLVIISISDVDQIMSWLNFGADDYIEENTDDQIVVKKVERLIEFKQLQMQLYHYEKMASWGSFFTDIAYEINNPLAVILGYAELINQKNKQSATVLQSSQKIIDTTLKIKEILDQLRVFCHESNSGNWKQVNINEVIQDALMLLTARLDLLGIKIQPTLAADIPLIWAVKSQLVNVIQTLLINSLKRFELLKSATDKMIYITSEKKDRDYVKIIFGDNSTGITEDEFKQMMSPFYSKNTIREEVSLSMSIILRIIRVHQGDIFISNKIEQGVYFEMIFPMDRRKELRKKVKTEKIKTAIKAAPIESQCLRPRLLAVDEDNDILSIITGYIPEMYDVIVVTNLKEAMLKIEQEKYDLIITEVNMSEGSGIDLLFKAKTCQRQTPVIIMSKYPADHNLMKHALSNGAADVLIKPFSRAEFLQKIKKQII